MSKLEDVEVKKGFSSTFQCNYCDKLFNVKSVLKGHLRTHQIKTLDKKTHKCTVCNKEFSSRYFFTLHMNDHDTAKVFKCETCEVYFAQKENLDDHVKNHLCQKPFKCTLCPQTFTKKFHLSIHVKTVHKKGNKKTYECHQCGEEFPSKYYLKVHMAEHDADGLSKCKICGKTFVFKANLTEHLNTAHLGHKRFKCRKCNKTFTRKYYHTLHVKSGHKNDTGAIQKCDTCDKEFRNKTYLKVHLKQHAKPECPLCFQPTKDCACSWNSVDDKCDRLQNRFARKNLMIRCLTCSKPILRNSQLKMHLRIHKDYKCILCNEDYKDCNCCDDYLEVSKTINTYNKKSGKSLTNKGNTGEPQEGIFAPVDEPGAKDEKELNDKCISCNEDYKDCSCCDDYTKVSKTINNYSKKSGKSPTIKESTAGPNGGIFAPAAVEPGAEDEKESKEVSDKCLSRNEDYKDFHCCDDYTEVSETINAYNVKSGESPTIKESIAEPKGGTFAPVDEPGAKDEKESKELSDKCLSCNEDYKDFHCCDDYTEVSETINAYNMKSGKSPTIKESIAEPKGGIFAPVDEPGAKDEKESKELSNNILSTGDKCLSCNQYYKNCSCSDDYMKVTKSINTYQKKRKRFIIADYKTSYDVKEEKILKVKEESIDLCEIKEEEYEDGDPNKTLYKEEF